MRHSETYRIVTRSPWISLSIFLNQRKSGIPRFALDLPPDPSVEPAYIPNTTTSRSTKLIPLCLLVATVTACATPSQSTQESSSASPSSERLYPTDQRPTPVCAENQHLFDCDRQAILAMTGNYHVTFNFEETAIHHSDYSRKPPKHSSGFETIILIEDTGRQISLQHILAMADGSPVKHWRQDWIYELSGHWHYTGEQRFELKRRNPESIPGTWTQLVYEVNDAPRYAGSGFWKHDRGVSSWTSEPGLRPLPRREYTTRNDYQLIEAAHRHSITPHGWTHEQDNLKIMLTKPAQSGALQLVPLVREKGFNEYRRITGFDFSQAQTYWQETAPFWKAVRARWQQAFKAGGAIKLAYPANDITMIDAMLEQADAYRKNPHPDAFQQQLESIFHKSIQTEKLVFSE